MPVQPIPVRGSRDPWEAFYKPAFEISVAQNEDLPGTDPGQRITAEILHDIEAVSYVDNVEESDSFTLTITNWDARRRKLKYYGYPRRPSGDDASFATFFEPSDHDHPKKFLLRLGYQGNLREMMVGAVTNIETAFPQAGAPTLKVQALDVLARRRKDKFTWRWNDRTDSEIAQELSQQPNTSKGRPGLGLPIETQPLDEFKHPRVALRNLTVPAFLLERAKLHAYSFFPKIGRGQSGFYFGPSERLPLPDDHYELEWGKTLLEFTPMLKTSGQARSVTVRASNRSGKGRVQAKATLSDFTLNQDLYPYLDALGEDKEISDRVMRTNDEAKELAKATMRTSLKSLLEVTGSTIGLPDLRAGQVIEIKGVDYRFDGRYFVTQTTHTVDTGGYKTVFKARREQDGSS
jgi:Bacteriophage probable baseplate hub protein